MKKHPYSNNNNSSIRIHIPRIVLALATAVITLTLIGSGTAGADTTEQMVKKVVGSGRSSGLVDPVATAAQALVDKDNRILLKAYDGTLKTGGGVVAEESVTVLASAATIAFAPKASSRVFKLTPGGAATINGVKTGAVPGRSYNLVITTSGTSTYTLTFGSNFKSTGTLATGTTTGKVFVLTFVFDGVNFNEVSRTTAM